MVREPNRNRLVLAKRGLCPAIPAVFRGPYEHVALAGSEERAAFFVGIFRHGTVKFGIVVDFEIHACPADGLPLAIDDAEIYAPRRTVVVDEVDFREIIGAQHHFLGAVVVAKGSCVHQQGARGRRVEPPEIQHGLGLAGSHEIPLAVGPGLHPGVVIVGVGPARRIDLSRRNADAAQGGHGEGRFLATASDGRLHAGQGRKCAPVARLVGHALVAPVVHLQNRLLHRHSAHAFL